jgi:hypothetical protein
MGRYADVTAFFQRANSLRVYQTARGAAAGFHFQLPIRFSLCADKSGVSLHAEANKLAYPFVALGYYIYDDVQTLFLFLPFNPRHLTGVNKTFHIRATKRGL